MTIGNPPPPSDDHDAFLLNGTSLGVNRPPEFRPRPITEAQLRQMDHIQWLTRFAVVTMAPTAVPMTPQRMGVATRLKWAAEFITLVQADLDAAHSRIKSLEGANANLTTKLAAYRKLLDEEADAADAERPEDDDPAQPEGR